MKKILAAVVGLAILSFLGYTHRDQVQARFSCADKVAHQFTTDKVVTGSWECLDPDLQIMLGIFYDVSDAKGLAKLIGIPSKYPASYTYLGKTNDGEGPSTTGGYTYRIDISLKPHNQYTATLNWIKDKNFDMAWREINGETQEWVSQVMTFYLYPDGTNVSGLDGQIHDVSGKVSYIQ